MYADEVDDWEREEAITAAQLLYPVQLQAYLSRRYKMKGTLLFATTANVMWLLVLSSGLIIHAQICMVLGMLETQGRHVFVENDVCGSRLEIL